MAALRLARFKVDPTDAEELLVRRNALVAAVRQAFPGWSRHGWPSSTTGPGWMRGAGTRAQRAGGHCQRVGHPQAAAVFSLVKDVTMEFADVVDER